MPTVAAAEQARRKLNDIRVEVPYPMHPNDSEPAIDFAFTVHARPHTPKVYFEKFESCAHQQRVEADTVRATELAALLDEERSIPEESRLAAVMLDASVQSAMVKPTDKLDTTIAYLRRVHLVNFYGAKRYRDEAHLLSLSPFVPHRVKDFVPTPPSPDPSAAAGGMEADGENADAAVISVGGKRKHNDEEEEEEEKGMDDAAAAAGGMEVEGAAKTAPRTGKSNRPVVIANP